MKMRDAVWLIGGTGTVGAKVARMLRQRHPTLPLVIASRRGGVAGDLARELGTAEAYPFDVRRPDFSAASRPALLVGLVNDAEDKVLDHALTRGLPYVDITRWPERQRKALVRCAAKPPVAPVVFASSWGASVAATMARRVAAKLGGPADAIDIDILYSAADKAGPDSVAYMDHLETPFEVMRGGFWLKTTPFTDGRLVDFGEGGSHRVYSFDTPDLASLPPMSEAKGVTTRIGFDQPIATGLLHLLVRSGLWRLISGPRFAGLRRSILYQPGAGAAHRIRISARSGERRTELLMCDPLGQSHLTATGAVVQVERVLGLDGMDRPLAGAIFGESLIEPEHMESRLLNAGIQMRWPEPKGQIGGNVLSAEQNALKFNPSTASAGPALYCATLR